MLVVVYPVSNFYTQTFDKSAQSKPNFNRQSSHKKTKISQTNNCHVFYQSNCWFVLMRFVLN